MSTTAVRTEATHMHVTYFAEGSSTAIVPRDIADAFRQLERLLEFAVLLTRDRADPSKPLAEVTKEHNVINIAKGSVQIAQGSSGPEAIKIWLDPGFGASPTVSVVSVRMASPLSTILEVPPEVWIPNGLGIIWLAHQVALTPARISRKKKEEALKQKRAEEEIATIEARSALLAELLKNEGPRRRGPDSIEFRDPDDPDEELGLARIDG